MTWHEFERDFEELMKKRPAVIDPGDPGGAEFDRLVDELRRRIALETVHRPQVRRFLGIMRKLLRSR